jgi:glycerol-3-phosphate dehydrogenase subunit C
MEKLPATDAREVVDLCYQCKLCFNHCPYTPPHRWEVDFPRIMLRARAAEARKKGVTLWTSTTSSCPVPGSWRPR